MPLLLFRTMVQADFHGSAPWALWATYFSAAALAWTAGHLVITRIFGRDAQAGVVGGVATAFSNLLLLGVPLMLGVFGQRRLRDIVADHRRASADHDDGVDHLVRAVRARENGARARAARRSCGLPAQDLHQSAGHRHSVLGLLWRATGHGACRASPIAPCRRSGRHRRAASRCLPWGWACGNSAFPGNVAPALTLSLLKLFLMPAVALGMAWLLGLPPLPAKVAGRGRRTAFRRQFLPDRHAVRHRPGICIQPDDDRHRLRGGYHRVLADDWAGGVSARVLPGPNHGSHDCG